MVVYPDVAERLARLAPDQRAAATAPPGPILCVAPAGSGKTTTLVARVAWLVAEGADPTTISAIAFNKRAAEELTERLDAALAPLGVEPGAVRVRTFHALGREVLLSAGRSVEPLLDRDSVLRTIVPEATPAERRWLDTAISKLKLDLGVDPQDVAGDPDAGPIATTFVAYERAIAASGGLDFDDFIARALSLLEKDPALLSRWRQACSHLLVDEAQDLDRSQLRLVALLAAPANKVFFVGDDDQSIYGWRLADVRRVLALAEALPGLRRVDLEVNYRCPAPVLARAVRLIEHNSERFAKTIRPGPNATGRLILAPDSADETVRIRRVLASWPDDRSTRAFLARTNRELLPAAAACLELDVPFRAPRLKLLLDSPLVDEVLDRVGRETSAASPLLVRLEGVRARLGAEGRPDADDPDEPAPADVARAVLGWAVPHPDLATFTRIVAHARARLADLRRDDAALSLVTAHATKGLEFDHVAVLGMEAGRFPSARTMAESDEPDRVMQEERRLAYVAWTRARRSLTLVYDPAVPSRFLIEAFTPDELRSPVG
jgi:DNA helicase II / ATP-dependent DNA helicase PcrA